MQKGFGLFFCAECHLCVADRRAIFKLASFSRDAWLVSSLLGDHDGSMYGYNDRVSVVDVFLPRNSEKKQPIVKLIEKKIRGAVMLLSACGAMDTENKDDAKVLVTHSCF